MEMIKPQFEKIKRSTMTAAESAEYVGVSLDMMYQLCRESKIPHFRIGSRILLRRDKLDEWIDTQIEQSMACDE